MARDFVVALPQQWELFSWNGPPKQGFLFAIENLRRQFGIGHFPAPYTNRSFDGIEPYFP